MSPEIDDQTMREVSAVSDYVTLVVKDETVFMAKRDVLIKASPFFEKLLNRGTQESKEGTIRLQMITASLMETILKFMYNGRTQINNVEIAMDLIVAADYLLLPSLKNFSEQFLERRLSTSNCTSIFYFAEENNCEELAITVRDFILSNFVHVAKSNEFLNLSCEEIEKWVSSDEIFVRAEEDVFEIIVGWIVQNKCERTELFRALFRHVRLIFVTRDYLCGSIATNILVKADASCVDCVTQALSWLDGKVDCLFPWQQLPRKSLLTHVIVACSQNKVICYFPKQDKWLNLPDLYFGPVNLVQCRGKLFAIPQGLNESSRFEPVLNQWVPIVRTESSVRPQELVNSHCGYASESQVFVFQGEIYVVMYNPMRYTSSSWKYDFNSSSWMSFPDFDLGQKDQVCIVTTKECIYAIGGRKLGNPNKGYVQNECLADVERFNMKEKTWDTLSSMHEARRFACGTAVQNKIFIAGGIRSDGDILQSCELYDILADQWHSISSLNVPRMHGSMVSVAERLYVLGGSSEPSSGEDVKLIVECYDEEKNEWKITTIIPSERITNGSKVNSLNACSVQLFNGVINTQIQSTRPSKPIAKSNGSRLCCIM